MESISTSAPPIVRYKALPSFSPPKTVTPLRFIEGYVLCMVRRLCVAAVLSNVGTRDGRKLIFLIFYR